MMVDKEKVQYYNYFCTVGSGLEKFCAKELTDLDSNIHEISLGKVFFSSCVSIKELLSLKTAERLFLLVHKGSQFLLSHPKRKSIQLLRNLVEESHTYSNWESCLKKWKEFHHTDFHHVPDIERLAFRVSCKCSGVLKRVYPPTFLGKILAGSLLNTHQKWTTNLRQPQLEVSVNASMSTFTIGLACCPMSNPLSKRSYLPSIGSCTLLRPTVCFAMLYIAMSNIRLKLRSYEDNVQHKHENIKRKPFVILDPMCGTGIILAEASASLDVEEGIILYGSDYDINKLIEASNNISSAISHKNSTTSSSMYKTHKGTKCMSELFVSDARALPLMDSSVDCIISDIPFGLKHQGIPWKRDISDTKKVTILEKNELSLEEHQIYQSESCNCNIHEGEYGRLNNVEVADAKTKKPETLMDIRLDATIESQSIVEEKTSEDSTPELNTLGEERKRKKLTTQCTSKMRKTDKGKHIDTTSINDVKNMFPLILTEMNRVLRKDGQAVLLISETLKFSLLDTVKKVTNSMSSFKYLCQFSNVSHSENFDCASFAKDNRGSDNLEPSNMNDQGHIAQTPLHKEEDGWICVEQHQVKLGLLDAVICVFNK